MALVGTLSTMPLPDLLQWLGAAEKTGTLRVERGRAVKSIRLREGRVTGCSSDDPSLRLGQFLLGRKKITEEQLRQALQLQEGSSRFLGQILVEMEALDSDTVREELEAKAHEVIYSLFDWPDAVFRFEDEEVEDRPDLFPVDIHVEDLLLRGMQRIDDMAMIRELLYDPQLILRYTSKPPGPEIFGDETSRAMYSAIDGERTLADILLHVHGTEYVVKKFLFDLHLNGYVEIAGLKPGAQPAEPEEPLGMPPLEIDVPPRNPPEPEPASDTGPESAADLPTMTVTEPQPSPPAPVPRPDLENATVADARRLMSEGELEAALDILDRLYSRSPGDDALRRLTAEAEAAFVGKAYQHYLPAHKVPILNSALESMSSESLTPQEFFLLSRIDGSWDVKSIIQVAPFTEVQALRTLKRLRELGMIELLDPA
jgi:hypothetical protein